MGGISQQRRSLLRSKGFQPQVKLPAYSTSVRKKFPRWLVVKISRDSVPVRWRAAIGSGILLKSLRTDTPAHQNPSKFQQRVRSLKGTKDLWGGTELSGFRERFGGAAFCWNKVCRTHCSFVSPLPHLPHIHSLQLKAGAKCESPLTCPHWWFSCPTQFIGLPESLSEVNPHKRPTWAHTMQFSKIHHRFVNPKQVTADLGRPCTFC